MDITITFQDGVWKTEPNPAIVVIGSRVRWIVKCPKSEYRKLRWRILFKGRNPFQEGGEVFEITTRNSKLGSDPGLASKEFFQKMEELNMVEDILVDHRGIVSTSPVVQNGQFKYDLQLIDPETDDEIDEDDPLLVVVMPITVFV